MPQAFTNPMSFLTPATPFTCGNKDSGPSVGIDALPGAKKQVNGPFHFISIFCCVSQILSSTKHPTTSTTSLTPKNFSLSTVSQFTTLSIIPGEIWLATRPPFFLLVRTLIFLLFVLQLSKKLFAPDCLGVEPLRSVCIP